MSEIGHFHPYHPEASLPPAIWQKAIQGKIILDQETVQTPSEEVLQLIRARQDARQTNDWSTADELRKQIELFGWEILDTKDGPVSRKLPKVKSNN
jgi:cysteinyl-tRNA synthetase